MNAAPAFAPVYETCGCFATTDQNLVLHPSFCERHAIEALAARYMFGCIRYERCFDREGDAKDRERVVRNLYASREDLHVQVVPIAHLWLVIARWGWTNPGAWGKP